MGPLRILSRSQLDGNRTRNDRITGNCGKLVVASTLSGSASSSVKASSSMASMTIPTLKKVPKSSCIGRWK